MFVVAGYRDDYSFHKTYLGRMRGYQPADIPSVVVVHGLLIKLIHKATFLNSKSKNDHVCLA